MAWLTYAESCYRVGIDPGLSRRHRGSRRQRTAWRSTTGDLGKALSDGLKASLVTLKALPHGLKTSRVTLKALSHGLKALPSAKTSASDAAMFENKHR